MRKKEPIKISRPILIAGIVAVAFAFYLLAFVMYLNLQEKPQKPEPAKINITLLGTDCEECAVPTINETIEYIKEHNEIEITGTRELNIENSKALALEYNITKLPAIVIQGNIDNLKVEDFNRTGNALVIEAEVAPYYDIKTDMVKGRFNVIHLIDPTCQVCYNFSSVLDKYGPVLINRTDIVLSTSDEGRRLIEKYNLTFLPRLIVTSEFLETESARALIEEGVWFIADDGMVVYGVANPPFRYLETGKIEGLVNATLLVDESCDDCYNVSEIKDGLINLYDMTYANVKYVDVSSNEGKALILKYSIGLAPAIIVSEDAGVYAYFRNEWTQWGTEEKDGSFVFRNLNVLKSDFAEKGKKLVYKNLTSGEKTVE